MYDFVTKDITHLKMIPHEMNTNFAYYGQVHVQLSLSDDFIAAVSSFGLVYIWERSEYKLVYQDSNSHFGNTSLQV